MDWRMAKAHKAFYMMALPGLLYFFIFHYTPMFGVIIAFKDYSPIQGLAGFFNASWAGLEHFERFFSSEYFYRIFSNTLIISGLKLLFGFPAPIVLALLIHEVGRRWFKRVVQTITYLPHFLSWVVLSGMLMLFLSPSIGVVNDVLKTLGLTGEGIFFLGSNDYFRSVLVLSHVWKEVGWGSIIYLAAISGINPHLYEAAMLDGANRWKQTLHITLPSIRNIISIMFILNCGSLLDAGFEQIFLLYSESVYATSDIIDTYVYREGLTKINYSFATAVGLFKSVLAMALMLGANMMAKRWGTERLW